MHSPIRIETVADLIARKHTLGLYCRHCDRWAEAPLERLAARGFADRPIRRLNFRCVRCGTSAQRQLRPPALPPARATGWMESPLFASPTEIDSEPGRRIQRPPYWTAARVNDNRRESLARYR
jgi:hypothetical protein